MQYKWNYLCQIRDRFRNNQEADVQRVFERIFSEVFGYASLDGEVDSQRVLHLGAGRRAIADIVIRDAASSNDLFVVELKRLNAPFTTQYEEQLISYMRLLSLKVGILVCEAIYVYFVEGKEILVSKVEFCEGNEKGAEFISLFNKGNFTEEKTKEFILREEEFKKLVERIKAEVKAFNLKDVVKLYLADNYPEDAIDEALKSYKFQVIEKGTPPPPPPPQGGKIFFEGQWYNQTRFVLAVVKAYVRDNPSITYNGLRVAFPDSLQGSWGVISTPKEVRGRTEDPNKRYHMDDLILLADNTNICVCSQWGRGLNTERFIAHTRKLGYTVFDPLEKK